MLRTTKTIKEKYERIQSILFSLIDNDKFIFISSVTSFNKKQNGEMFFYYIPKGILKKKPINVYEVPQRFNINEEQYLSVVKNLYECIKELKQDFINTDQDLWTNFTITITNINFRIEYNYEQLPTDEKENEKNRMIWRYKYLGIGGERKEEQKILEEYFSRKKTKKDEIYETGLYMKTDNFGIRFDREEDNFHREFIIYEKDNDYMKDLDKKPKEKNKIEMKEKKKKHKEEFEEEEESHIKNQILN